MRWTPAEYEAYQARRASSSAKPKPPVRHDAVPKTPRASSNTPRLHLRVRVASFRRRLIDPDNLCVKWFVDAAKQCGHIPDDTAEDITLEVRQEKVKTKAEERTEITIDEPL